jgi:hypothetical protein
MSAKRVDMLKTSMDANDRDTDETSMKRHTKGVKDYVNELEEFDESKLQDYFKNYCSDDDNFEEIEEVKKPKRTLSEEQKAKMKAGREAAKAAREAAAAEKAAESEKDEEKPKKAKAKSVKA